MAAPTISLVVAVSENGVIGRDGSLPWHLPDELAYFKRITLGKPVVMGRKTFESIGRPLPGRRNVVISRNPDFEAPSCEVVDSPRAALELLADADEIMVIGGSHIFEAVLPRAHRIYLTRVAGVVEGDTHFADPDDEWTVVSREHHAADEKHEYAYDLLVLERQL